ncbi:hypothetical protein DE146DRAFT_792189 [Phaeosphaeria sp. MPI-PUGE-AT-0046c]|nr:hypothetical protein DE146DRAFT_792189 [Phaeosphaeria sp. MPI-PUGE-AT-0046c]
MCRWVWISGPANVQALARAASQSVPPSERDRHKRQRRVRFEINGSAQHRGSLDPARTHTHTDCYGEKASLFLHCTQETQGMQETKETPSAAAAAAHSTWYQDSGQDRLHRAAPARSPARAWGRENDGPK